MDGCRSTARKPSWATDAVSRLELQGLLGHGQQEPAERVDPVPRAGLRRSHRLQQGGDPESPGRGREHVDALPVLRMAPGLPAGTVERVPARTERGRRLRPAEEWSVKR